VNAMSLESRIVHAVCAFKYWTAARAESPAVSAKVLFTQSPTPTTALMFGWFAGCENDVLVVHDPLHQGNVIPAEMVRARISQVLRVGNNGDGEIGVRCSLCRDGSSVRETPCRCAGQTAQEGEAPKPRLLIVFKIRLGVNPPRLTTYSRSVIRKNMA